MHRLIVPFGRDGATDRVARRIAQALIERGAQLEVENVPGEGGLAGMALAAAAADALLFGTSTLHCIAPLLESERVGGLREAFVPVALVGSIPNVLVVSPALGVHSLTELIALAKAKPDALAYASAGAGQTLHLCGALFAAQCGLKLRHVPYAQGSPLAHPDLLAGRVAMMFESVAAALGLIREGHLLALAVTGARRSPLLPDVPTMAEAGVDGFEADVWFGIHAHVRAGAEEIGRWERRGSAALADAATRRDLEAMGVNLAGGGALGPVDAGACALVDADACALVDAGASALADAIARDTPLWRAWLARCGLLPARAQPGRSAAA